MKLSEFYHKDAPTVGQQRSWCILLLSEIKDLLAMVHRLQEEVSRVERGSLRLTKTALSGDFSELFGVNIPSYLEKIELGLLGLRDRARRELDRLTAEYHAELVAR